MALLVFDLDGTLVDPLPAIRHSLDHTCRAHGLAPVAEADILPHIGPGIQGLFQGRIPDPVLRDAALATYWEHFREEGIPRHQVYPGVNLLLTRLKHQGHRMFVVTAKPTPCARRVLHQFDLYLMFDEVFGSDAAGPWRTKAELLAQAQETGALEGGGLLVGDRSGDMEAARSQGLRPIGVAYGYGSREELLAAGAEHVLDSVAALDGWLRDAFAAPETLDLFSRSE